MPRNVRNFWLELEVDGRATRIETGPRSGSGGFHLVVRIREGGTVSGRTLVVSGRVVGDNLLLRAHAPGNGQEDITITTER